MRRRVKKTKSKKVPRFSAYLFGIPALVQFDRTVSVALIFEFLTSSRGRSYHYSERAGFDYELNIRDSHSEQKSNFL